MSKDPHEPHDPEAENPAGYPGRAEEADKTATDPGLAEELEQEKARESGAPAETEDTADRLAHALQQTMSHRWTVAAGAVLLAVFVGSVMIAFTDEDVTSAAGYFFARPGDLFVALGDSIGGAYSALFRGAVFNPRADTFVAQIRPLTETLNYATPLITAGLGVALAFRAGLLNIGGQGQMIMAAIAAGWVGFGVTGLPFGVHTALAVVAGIAGGAIWAGIAGFLKARTGAHEVIVTIMLNWIAFYLFAYLLSTPGLMQAPGSSNPKTPPTPPSAQLPGLLGDKFNLHWGFVLALGAVVFVWWLLNRSSEGFQYRAVGENPRASRVAGIDVSWSTIKVMLVAGGLVGLAGASQVLGQVTTGFSGDIDAGIGFDAITVALLGGSNPWGVLAAGILFGAFEAGGTAMQASEGVPSDIVTVVQALIVLFIAAPTLVRAIFRLPELGKRRPAGTARTARKEAA